MISAYLTSEGPLRDYEVPDYRYFPTRLLTRGTRDWARVRFLQACERLQIPPEHWPRFELLHLPGKGFFATPVPAFTPPPFEYLLESMNEWRRKAERLFRQHCNRFGRQTLTKLKSKVADGTLTKIRRSRGKVPLTLQYEWAARRYCLGQRYKEMATAKYTDAAIRQTVHRILASLEL
jgi:hypothetical protein